MSFLYRIQDSEGRGPFKPNFSHLWVKDRPDHANLLPFFQEFPDIKLPKNLRNRMVVCGCEYPNQLRRWFLRDEYKKLTELGYQCVKIPIDRVLARSEVQTLAVVWKNRRIEQINLY